MAPSSTLRGWGSPTVHNFKLKTPVIFQLSTHRWVIKKALKTYLFSLSELNAIIITFRDESFSPLSRLFLPSLHRGVFNCLSYRSVVIDLFLQPPFLMSHLCLLLCFTSYFSCPRSRTHNFSLLFSPLSHTNTPTHTLPHAACQPNTQSKVWGLTLPVPEFLIIYTAKKKSTSTNCFLLKLNFAGVERLLRQHAQPWDVKTQQKPGEMHINDEDDKNNVSALMHCGITSVLPSTVLMNYEGGC